MFLNYETHGYVHLQLHRSPGANVAISGISLLELPHENKPRAFVMHKLTASPYLH